MNTYNKKQIRIFYDSSHNININNKKRETGIDIIGDVTWGTHLCQFYKTKEDLIDILVPYFKKGLENNEFCMWITSEPLHVDEAKIALGKAVNNLGDYLKKEQIEILDVTEWYTKSGKFNADKILAGWVEKETQARKKGFDGLRLSGNTFWLEKKDWEDFKNYEEIINHVIGKYNMIAICSYSLDKCNASEIIDVVSNHQFAVIKREGKWSRIENPELKKTEDELEVNNQLFQTIVNFMPSAVNLIRGSDLRIQMVNPAYKAIAPGKDMLGKTLDELWPETGQNFAKLCCNVLITGEPYYANDELNMIRRQPDGPLEPAYFSWSLHRVLLPGDEGFGILNIAWETTERKKTEQDLENKMHIINQIQDGIVIVDKDFQIIFWNKGAEQLFGYSQAEALGKKSFELLHPIYSPGEREKIINELNNLGKSKAIINMKNKNGNDIIVEANSKLFVNKFSPTKGYVVSYRDVTDREKSQKALKDAELKYRTVADNTYDFEFWIDQEGRYIYASPASKRITGYDSKDFLSDCSLRKQIIHPDDQQKFSDHITTEFSERKHNEIKIRIIHKNGSIRWIHHVCQPIKDENGNFLGIRGSNRDITESKELDDAFKKSELSYRRLFESAKDGILLIDFNTGLIVDVNPFLTKLLGYRKDNLLKKHLWEIGVLKDIIPSRNYFLKLKEKKYIRYEDKPLLTRSGKKIDVEFVSNVYEVNGNKTIQCNIRDITERKKAEEQLRETRDYLENLINYANAPIIVWGKNFKITRFNHAFEHLTGYKSNMIIGKKLDILFPKENKEESLKKIQRTLTGEHWRSVDIPILDKKGIAHIILWNSANIYDELGKKLIATIAQGQDITDRKKIENRLRDNEIGLKKAQELAHLGSWEIDLIYNKLTWSDEVYRIFGLKPKEFNPSYETFLKMVHPDDRAAVDSAYSGSIREKKNTYEIEHRIVRKNGEIRFVFEKCDHIYDQSGKVIRSIGMVHDITDRKNAERIIQESEEKYRNIVENTTNLIMVTQPNGIISYLSPACKEILGFLPDELIGANPNIFHPDDLNKVQHALSQALNGKKGSGFEYRIITKQGKIKWISHSWAPIFIDNKLQSIVSLIDDITQRKETEKSIIELNENLLHQADELAASNKELESFSYSVSHDLRGPLRSIDGFSQALLEDYSEKLDNQGKEYIQRVLNSTKRMGQLIDDMLRLSRLTRTEMNFQRVNLSKTALTIINDLKKAEPNRNVKFIKQENLIAKGDNNLIHILLENLLGNAWKFTKKCKKAKIEFGKIQQGNETVFFIKDNGAGFDMKYYDKLFLPFQRLHNDTDYPGTGIGLGIVARIIHRHGGRIWAESQENKGSVFYFTLGGKLNE